MSVKEYLSFEGATLGTGLAEAVQDGTRGRGVETSLSAAVVSSKFPNHKLKGALPGITIKTTSPKTVRQWTARKDIGRGSFCFDPQTGHIDDTIDQGSTSRGSRTTIDTNAEKTALSAFKTQRKFKVVAAGGRKLVGLYNSANTNIVNFLGIFHNNNGTFHMRYFNSSGTLTNSAASSSVIVQNADYSMEIEIDPGTTTAFLRFFIDATNDPGDADGDWTGTVPDETLTVSISGAALSMNEQGWSPLTTNFNGFHDVTTQIWSNGVDFENYTTASPIADVVQVAFAGTIDPVAAELIILKNGVAQPLDSPLVEIRVKVDGVVVTTPTDFVLFSVYRGIGVMSPSSTMDYSFKIVNPNVEDKIQIFDCNPGVSAETVASSPGGGDIDTVFKESGTPVVRILLGETFDVTGNLIFNVDLTGAQVDINVRKFSNDALIQSLFSGTVDFSSGVAKTFATINGGTAPSFIPVLADEYTIEIKASHADIQDLDEKCGLIVNRIPLEPTLNSFTVSDGQVIFNVAPVDPADRVFARVAEVEAPWPPEDGAFSVLGSGNITVTPLTNSKLHTATFYSEFGDLTSDWTKPIFFFITDGSDALMKQIMDAVASRINAASLVDSGSDSIAATVQIPPIFENVTVAQVLVFPDNAPLEPERSGLNNNIFRVSVAFCEQQNVADADQQKNQLFIRERIQALFVGQRLDGLPEVYCQAEVSPFVLDLQEIQKNFNWISAITLEFFTLTVRG